MDITPSNPTTLISVITAFALIMSKKSQMIVVGDSRESMDSEHSAITFDNGWRGSGIQERLLVDDQTPATSVSHGYLLFLTCGMGG